MKGFIKKLFRDLFQDNRSGSISVPKFWLNIAFLVSSFLVVLMALKDSLSVDIFIAYVLIVSGNSLTSTFISMKYDRDRHPDGFNEPIPPKECDEDVPTEEDTPIINNIKEESKK